MTLPIEHDRDPVGTPVARLLDVAAQRRNSQIRRYAPVTEVIANLRSVGYPME